MKARITKIINETPYTKTFRLKLDKSITYKPGQFITVISKKDGVVIRRAYSISNWFKQPTEEITITLNEVPNGKMSCFLFCKNINDTIDIEGPFGLFTLKETQNPVVFIAAGTGITPLMTMMQSLKDKDITLIYSVKKQEDILFRDKLELLNINKIITLTQEKWNGQTGRISKGMILKNIKLNSDFYICGLPEFVKSVVSHLEELNVPKENVHVERW
ncbi:MAG: FAD-dependent oxidoreductase [Nanoarchaeota archaeon]|nr:FAD-dependent oxidoreductase [Nanoarchaeota archaeon]